MYGETTLKGLDLFDWRWAEGAVGDIVQLYEVDVAERSRAEVDKRLHLGVRVVDTIDHREFVSRAPTGFLDILLDSLMEAKQRELLDPGHELVARALDRGVQGDGEGELLGELGEAADAGDNAAGGDCEVAGADGESRGIVQHAESLDGVVEVGEGLSLTHEDDTRDAFTEVARDMEHLVHHLLGREGAGEARETGGAKCAAHGATSLR